VALEGLVSISRPDCGNVSDVIGSRRARGPGNGLIATAIRLEFAKECLDNLKAVREAAKSNVWRGITYVKPKTS
jgi:hypothetical protein